MPSGGDACIIVYSYGGAPRFPGLRRVRKGREDEMDYEKILGIILDTVEESRQAGRVEEGKTEVQLARELDELKKQIETVQRLLDKSNNEMSKR